MKRIAILFVLSCSAWATTSATVGVTNTQAVLTVHTDQTGSCTFKLSTVNDFSGTYSPVNDVNTTLFPGSDSCSRAFDIHVGNDYQIVAGKRAAETASDGKRYSRALQAYTTHYYQISVGSDTVTGQFTTANIPVGHTWNDPLPVDPNNPGQYAYPTLDFTDQTKSYIDPQTGALLKLLTLPGDVLCYNGDLTCYTSAQPALNFQAGIGAAPWASPTQSLGDDSLSATISGSQIPIAITGPNWNSLFYSPGSCGTAPCDKSHTTATSAIGSIQLTVNAWCSDSGDACPSVAAADRTWQFALTADGVNPAGTWTDLVVSGCASGCTTGNRYTVGTTTPVLASWFDAAGPTFDVTDMFGKNGTVTCNATTAVAYASGDGFGLRWGAGSAITINSVVYTIASLTDARDITLTTTCPTGTWNYSANNFGVLVRKKTTSADTLFLQYVGVGYQTMPFSQWDVSGDEESNFNCSSTTVAGPGGEMGYHCMSGQEGNLLWIGATTGNRTRIGALWLPDSGVSPDGWGSQEAFPGAYWDKTDPNTFYTTATSKGGKTILVKAVYSGSNADVGPMFPNGASALVKCGSPPCWTLTDITPPSLNQDITTQVNNFSSDWATWGEKGSITITGFDGGYMMLEGNVTNAPSNNFSCFWGAFSLQTNTIVAFAPSWKYWPNRWAACHGAIHINDPTYMIEAAHGYSGGWSGVGSNGAGPWTALITSGAITTAGQACPGGLVDPRLPNPPTGNNCLQVTLDGAPCDPSPGPNEPADGGVHCGNAAAYYLQDLAPGDIVCISNVPSERGNDVPGCGDGYLATAHDNGVEYFRVLVVSGNTITLERGWYGPDNPRTTPFLAKNSGASIVAVPGGCDYVLPFSCPSAITYWNFIADPLGQNGNTLIDYKNVGAGHGVTRTGIQASSVAISGTGIGITIDTMFNGSPIRGVYPNIPALIASNYGYASNDAPFNWKVGCCSPNTVDGHPGWTQYTATGQEQTWFSDVRPFLGADPNGGNFMQNGFSQVSGQLYKIAGANLGRYRPKLLPTLAFAYYHPLYDVSGPGSSITGSASDAYKRCTALIAGECDPSSSIGDVYVNAGTATANTFTSSTPCPWMGAGGLNAELKGICFGDNGAYTQGATQSSLTKWNNFGAYNRVLSHLFSRYIWTFQFMNAKALPGAEWLVTFVPWLNGVYGGDVMIKLPPFPNATSQPGGTYTPITIQVPGTTGDTVAAKFGYVENEPAGSASPSLNCTSRKDACYTTSSPTATVPFLWASESQSWTPCGAGCTVAIPAIPGRVLYYEIDRKNGATTTPGTVRALAVQ